MIEKYYNGVIEQVYNRIGKESRNIVMVNYSNVFSIANLEKIKYYQQKEDHVFFVWHEFEYDTLVGAYEPFLDTICNMYRRYMDGDFGAFLEKCKVYELQRKLFLTYYECGVCEREESVLLNEVAYEQRRMTKAMADMLTELSKEHPVVIVINRFQMASRSTMELVRRLLDIPSKNIGLVLGVSEMQPSLNAASEVWDSIVELLRDNSKVYHIGNSGGQNQKNDSIAQGGIYAESLAKVKNTIGFLDYDQAKDFFQDVEYKIKFEDVPMDDTTKREFYLLYAHNSILLGEISKALEVVSEALRIPRQGEDHLYRFECAFLKATGLMYQSKLDKAEKYAKRAYTEAVAAGDEKQIFRAELLAVMVRMSGWYNVFFCVQDISIEENLFEKMMKYNYKNHLAHVYIYAYDNSPEGLAKAYRSEKLLRYFSKGVAMAKEIGNEQLVDDAYQKNIMLAAANGMNEIAVLYSVRTYQFMETYDDCLAGRIFSGIGYNLSAMGRNHDSEMYYNRAIEIFYHLRLPEEIAEVYYNRAMNDIMQEKYSEAEHDLQLALKTVEKLHLNSLRVCNLSKLYGLLALSCILQNDRFNCERYLLNCRQFLNYIIEKEKENHNAEVIHDYAKCDDDMFLYTFALALLNRMNGENEEAMANFEKAEGFLVRTEGNQFFSYCLFRRERMSFFKEMGRTERYEREKMFLEQREELNRQIAETFPQELLDEVDMSAYTGKTPISEREIERLLKQEALQKEYTTIKNQMEFISTWQKQVDVNDEDVSSMLQNAISVFCNHFSLDCALYIYFQEGTPKALYNDTGHEMTDEVMAGICKIMEEAPKGIVVSKISDSFFEHQNIISYFGADDVCSFIAAPFLKNGKLTSLLITYVRMKDNWHGSIERYMLNEDDLSFYTLLFREMEHSIRRMESNQKVLEVNRKLQTAASTDMLTGIYNRTGMYEEIHRMAERISASGRPQGMGLMFIDLDNFKHYNDTYGHDVGDLVLKEMADIFKQAAMEKGFVSRFGGDEFIVILNTDDRGELEDIAKDIYGRIKASDGFKAQIEEHLGHEITMDKGSLVTCSIGIAQAGNVREEDDISQLICKADDLLYSVKTGRKGHYAFL